ncbi:MAG: purD [Rickettsiales bacterium]|jgi:phosphoribosylamine--glycine ligase|nr:purD [Rickettsiales bacterium]
MKILVIGSGGREHALIWALKKSPKVSHIYAAPGNAGTKDLAQNVFLAIGNHEEVIEFCRKNDVGLVVVGPEAPLVAGIVDDLEKAGIPTVGPSAAAAQLEGSKGFTKAFCDRHNIPTAAYGRFEDAASAKAYVKKQGLPIVVKADGLASGKGVIIAHSEEEAFDAIDTILGGKFGDAGSSLVVEAFLEGEELSFFALVDGERALAFGSAQDHKAVGDGDTGPNTGGMGTYSPAPLVTPELERDIMTRFIEPTVRGMKAEGNPFKGILFAGFMITKNGPELLEYNTRFGDPETQSLMLRLKSDLFELFYALATGNLSGKTVELEPKAALCVVMAANGYPEDYQKGTVIRGLDKAAAKEGVMVFHAGTRTGDNGEYLANGGRVLGIAAIGSTVVEAQKRAYAAVDVIDWKEGFCRRDIGWRAIEHLKAKVS